MCLSNDQIREILGVQRKRYLARVRYWMTQKDGNNIQFTRERAEYIAARRYGKRISYQESLKPNVMKCNGGEWWGECLPEITSQACPIPYMPYMPLTRCLDCKSEFRRAVV